MRVVKLGKIPEKKEGVCLYTKQYTCKHCKTVFETNASDWNIYGDVYVYVSCPLCGLEELVIAQTGGRCQEIKDRAIAIIKVQENKL
jgi:ribosomal protein S27E